MTCVIPTFVLHVGTGIAPQRRPVVCFPCAKCKTPSYVLVPNIGILFIINGQLYNTRGTTNYHGLDGLPHFEESRFETGVYPSPRIVCDDYVIKHKTFPSRTTTGSDGYTMNGNR